MKGLVVECIGISGCGKSTVAGFLDAELSRRGHRTVDRDELIRLEMRRGVLARLVAPLGARPRWTWYKKRRRPGLLRDFADLHPEGWRRCREQLERIAARDPAEAALLEGWIETKMGCFMSMRAQGRSFPALIWEEGIAHRAVNLFASVREDVDDAALEDFLSAWAFPDLLILVRADVATAYARLEARGRSSRLVECSEAEVRAFLERSARVAEAIAAEARRRGLEVLEIDNGAGDGEVGLASPGVEACLDGLSKRLRGDSDPPAPRR